MTTLEKPLKEIKKIGNIQFSSWSKPLIAVEDVIKIIESHVNTENCKKYYYTMSLTAEGIGAADVLLTPEEAITVKKALDQMQENLVGIPWCGHCCIDIDDPHTQKIDFSIEEKIK